MNQKCIQIPCDGVDVSQLIVEFPALGNIPVYQTAMQLTTPPSAGYQNGTRLLTSFGYSNWKKCAVMVTAPQLEDFVSILAQGGLYVMIQQERYFQIDEDLDIEPERKMAARQQVDLALQQVFGLDIIERHQDTRFDPDRGLITADDEGIIENLEFLQRDGNPFFELATPLQNANNTQQHNLPLGFQAGDASHLSLDTRGEPTGPPDPAIARVHDALARQGVSDARIQTQFNSVQAQQSGNFTTNPPQFTPAPNHIDPVPTSNPQASAPAGNRGPAAVAGS
jgi:hypothetical protein